MFAWTGLKNAEAFKEQKMDMVLFLNLIGIINSTDYEVSHYYATGISV